MATVPKRYPRFIGGTQRSGSWLLMDMLSQHPNVWAAPVEVMLCRTLSNIPCDRRIMGQIVNKVFIELCRSRPGSDTKTGKNDKGIEARRWYVLKWPAYSIQYSFLQEMFSFFKLVNIIRDLRDTACSFMRRGAKKYGWEHVCTRLANIHRLCLEQQLKDLGPEQSFTISLEGLMFETEKTLRKVCKFYGFPWAPEIMNWPVDVKRSYHKWKTEMPKEVQEWCLKKFPDAYYYKKER